MWVLNSNTAKLYECAVILAALELSTGNRPAYRDSGGGDLGGGHTAGHGVTAVRLSDCEFSTRIQRSCTSVLVIWLRSSSRQATTELTYGDSGDPSGLPTAGDAAHNDQQCICGRLLHCGENVWVCSHFCCSRGMWHKWGVWRKWGVEWGGPEPLRRSLRFLSVKSTSNRSGCGHLGPPSLLRLAL